MNYDCDHGRVVFHDQKKGSITLSNFSAKIEEEHKYIDGQKVDRYYLITGMQGKDELSKTTVKASDYPTMSWVTTAWGSQAIIFPGGSGKELLRAIFQIESKPKIVEIYTATGWQKIKKQWHYLTTTSAITAEKRTKKINLQLPEELSCISLPIDTGDIKQAFLATIALTRVAPPEIAWMIIGSIFRAAIGPADFCVHITGRTGTFKSELAALAQSHYGPTSARDLPANWSSTANALEALAYKAKNCLLVVDDFIPGGTSWQVKAYQKTADQLIRGQGNQAGRARLTDTSNLQRTMYPRGVILSTGEDTPEGHSVRARMMIAELSPEEIKPQLLRAAQDARELYCHGMAAYIQWLAHDLDNHRAEVKEIADGVRDENLTVGHARTPPTMGSLQSGIFKLLQWATETKIIEAKKANDLYAEAEEAIKSLGRRQIEYLQAADPVEQFLSTLRSIFAASAGHIRAINGGPPPKADLLGWSSVGTEGLDWKPHGPRLGWYEEKTQTLLLDSSVAYDTIRRHSRGTVTITRQTLYKRLREAGLLTRVDQNRQRNTVRVQAENAGRMVLCLSINAALEGE